MTSRAGWLTQITRSVNSGYDFGYFVKLLTGQSLPTNEETFFDTLHTWFPTIYDIKFVMRSCKVLKGGLQDVADDLGVRSHAIVSALTAAAHTRNVSVSVSAFVYAACTGIVVFANYRQGYNYDAAKELVSIVPHRFQAWHSL